MSEADTRDTFCILTCQWPWILKENSWSHLPNSLRREDHAEKHIINHFISPGLPKEFLYSWSFGSSRYTKKNWDFLSGPSPGTSLSGSAVRMCIPKPSWGYWAVFCSQRGWDYVVLGCSINICRHSVRPLCFGSWASKRSKLQNQLLGNQWRDHSSRQSAQCAPADHE